MEEKQKEAMAFNQSLLKGVKTRVDFVTPQMAESYLSHNTENRKINNGTVRRYYNDIINGKWVLNGEPIVIDRDGVLRNGQHRMMAVVKAGKAIPTVIVEGVDPAAFRSMDTGHLRTPADVLRIDNVPYADVVASIITKYLAIKYGRWAISPKGDANLTASGKYGCRNVRVVEECNANYELYQDMAKIVIDINKERGNLCKKLRLRMGDIGAITVYLYKECHHPISDVIGFFNELLSIDVKEERKIVSELRRILVNDYDSVGKHMLPKTRQSLIAKAWNLYNTKPDAKRLFLTSEEEKSGVKFL